MKNKTIVWVVVAVVVVAGLAWWLVGRSPAVNAPSTAGTAQSGNGSPMSMASLLAAGTSQKCTFMNTAASGAQTNGTVYVASGHMRGDFTAQTSAGQTMTSHMITDGKTSWVWTDQTAQGMKMSFAGVTAMSSTPAGASQPQSVDPNQAMNYSCSGWAADQSEFTLPANITFNDMSAMMQGAAGVNGGAGVGAGASAGSGGNSAMCSQCNQIPNAAAKAQCLTALGCK